MIETIFDFLSTTYGRAVIRAIASFLILVCIHFAIMSFAGQICEMEKSVKLKKLIKLFAVIFAVIISVLANVLLSYVFYKVNNNQKYILEAILYYLISAGLYSLLVSDNVRELIKIIRRRK
jgi:hypothetical protein